MPELSTILTVVSAAIVLAVVVITIVVITRNKSKRSAKTESPSEVITSTIEPARPTDSPASVKQATDEKEPIQSVDSTVISEAPTKLKAKISPENRGGARRGKRTTEATEKRPDKKQRVRRPELVCWKQSRKWFLGVEFQAENGEASEVRVTQSNSDLTKASNSRWQLSDLFESITVARQPTNEQYELQPADKERPFLLFKLAGENLNSGRRVRYASSGVYLVIAPQDWIRDDAQSGTALVPPSHCHLACFQAHFFHLNSRDNDRIAFRNPDGRQIQVPNGNSRFDLEGCKIDDANDEMGPFFGRTPPFLTANDITNLKDIETIVLGEEGNTSNGWRESFKPDTDNARVNLPPYLQGKEAGWFFLRIYDTNDELIDSLDFRFAKSLYAIRIDEHNILPSEEGHKSVKIALECANSLCNLFPSGHNLKAERVDKTRIEIEVPPQPDNDRTEWIFWSSTKEKVNLALLVERVWWTICKPDIPIEHSEWQDRALPLSATHLKATSSFVLRIRLPKPRWTKKVRIGFDERRSRTYPIEVSKNTVDIPLNHFEGVSQLEDSSQVHPLFLWLDESRKQTVAFLSTEKRQPVRRKSKTPIRLNLKRLIKYINRLDRRVKDDWLSIMLSECKKKWMSPGVRQHRGTYEIETACLISLSWHLLKANKMKVIGRRKGWIRAFTKIADSNPSFYSSTVQRYKALKNGDKIHS
ncbi:hypothetical protein FBQ87_03370 [Sphingobacteriales bacterium CHB3]|nr:hypothetical protein [Sphingobacteriales bacterium CHB3]